MREGSLGNSPSNETSCLSFWKEVRQNRLFATLVVLLRLMMGGTLQYSAAEIVIQSQKRKEQNKIFPLLLSNMINFNLQEEVNLWGTKKYYGELHFPLNNLY